MGRVLDAVACSCVLWLACVGVHEKQSEAIADASGLGSFEDLSASTARANDTSASTVSAADSATQIDRPSERCMRVVLDVDDQPYDLEPCVYAIDPRVVDPLYLAVIVGGRICGLDRAQDGFHHEVGRVTLLGAACDEARRGASVEMRTSCQPIGGEARGEFVVPECHVRVFDANERPVEGESRCRYRVLQTVENAKYIRVVVGGRVVQGGGGDDGFSLGSGVVTLLGNACERALLGERVEIASECNGLVGLD